MHFAVRAKRVPTPSEMKITSKKKKGAVTRGIKKKKNKRNDEEKLERWSSSTVFTGGGVKTAIKNPLKTQYAFHKFRSISRPHISARVIRIPVRPDIYDEHTRSSKTALYRSQVSVHEGVRKLEFTRAGNRGRRRALPVSLGSFYKPLSEE